MRALVLLLAAALVIALPPPSTYLEAGRRAHLGHHLDATLASGDSAACTAATQSLEWMLWVLFDCCNAGLEARFVAAPTCNVTLCALLVAPPSQPPLLDLMPFLDEQLPSSDWVNFMLSLSAGLAQQRAWSAGENAPIVRAITAAWTGMQPALANGSVSSERWLDVWRQQYAALAAQLTTAAAQHERTGNTISARDTLLRASLAYALANYPLASLDSSLPLLKSVYLSFFQALESPSWPHFCLPLSIDYTSDDGQAVQLPGVFCAPSTEPADRSPLMLLSSGLDFPFPGLFLQNGMNALRRGYAVVTFDGPGQAIVRHTPPNLPLTPRWDRVLAAVLATLRGSAEIAPLIDFDNVVSAGLSFGGWLNTQACSALSDQFAACVLDPPLASFFTTVTTGIGGAFAAPFATMPPSAVPAPFVPYVLAVPAGQALMGAMLAPGCASGLATMRQLFAQMSPPADPTMLYFAYELGLNATELSPVQFATISNNLTLLLPYFADALVALNSFALDAAHIANITAPLYVPIGKEDSFEAAGWSEALFAALPASTRAQSSLQLFNSSSGAALHCQVGAFDVYDGGLFDFLPFKGNGK